MRGNLIKSLCLLPAFLILFPGVILGDSEPKKNETDLTALFNKIVKWEGIPCPDNSSCLCIKLEPRTTLLPVSYTYSQGCPVDAPDNDASKRLLKVTNYTEDWRKVAQGQYLNGQMHGKWISWHLNGTIESEGYYDEGQPTGMHIFYHENGNEAVKGAYLNGQMHGEWVYRDEGGHITKRFTWVNGQVVSQQSYK